MVISRELTPHRQLMARSPLESESPQSGRCLVGARSRPHRLRAVFAPAEAATAAPAARRPSTPPKMAPPMMAALWLCWNQSAAASRNEGGTAAEGEVRFSSTSARTLPPEAGGGRQRT